MEMKCHVDLALVAGAFSQHEHEPRSRLGRQSHIRSTIRQDQSSVKKFSHARDGFLKDEFPPVLMKCQQLGSSQMKMESEVIVSFAATKARSARTLMVAASSSHRRCVLERAATIKKAAHQSVLLS